MEAKCPKCDSTEFSLVRREDKAYCYVACKNCNAVIGVLENVNFNKSYETITRNQNGIDRHISKLEMKVDELEKKNKDIWESVEKIETIVCQISKKIR